MTDLVAVLAAVAALTAAVRSTWSPCGLSMLSTITPLAERGRGHRYRSTAAWFVVGATVGGATLGAVMAAGAAAVGAAHLGPAAAGALAAAGAALAAASDARLTGRSLPIHRRQVNELWLDQFRPWVYGAGFGWQIGCGLATYIMTAGVYLTILLSVLTGRPAVALAIGVLFGVVRGLAVLLSAPITSPAALVAFHRWFDPLGERVRRSVVGVLAGCATAAAAAAVDHRLARPAGWAVVAVAVGATVWALRPVPVALVTRDRASDPRDPVW